MRRRDLLIGAAASALSCRAAAGPRRAPNIILVLADDLGWGDVGVYGASAIHTPHLDRMAREGVRLTSAYSSANICTPSRAGMLTGRYPIRTGLGYDVIRQGDTHGLPLAEVTLAEMLKPDYPCFADCTPEPTKKPDGKKPPTDEKKNPLPNTELFGKQIAAKAAPLASVCASEIEIKPVVWLWPGWLPRGKVGLLDGNPGLGKSTVTLDLAARITRGAPMPDGAKSVSGSVVLVSYEDDAGSSFPRHYTGAVEIETTDGRRLRAREDVNKGSSEAPLSQIEVERKFMDNALTALSPARAEALRDALLGIDRVADVRDVEFGAA